jgi:hypothetical protein
MLLLQQRQNRLNAYHFTNTARNVMIDSLKQPSRCVLLAYVMRRILIVGLYVNRSIGFTSTSMTKTNGHRLCSPRMNFHQKEQRYKP